MSDSRKRRKSHRSYRLHGDEGRFAGHLYTSDALCDAARAREVVVDPPVSIVISKLTKFRRFLRSKMLLEQAHCRLSATVDIKFQL